VRANSPATGPATDYRFRLLAAFAAAAIGTFAAAPAVAGADQPRSDPVGLPPAPRVTIALLPNGTSVEALGRVPGLAPGLLSAGFSDTGAEQTYLDIGQGNRVFKSLYDSDQPPPVLPRGTRVPDWHEIVDRADSAPADIIPGLLASSVPGGIAVAPQLLLPALLAADRAGRIERGRPQQCRPGAPPPAPAVVVVKATITRLRAMVPRLCGNDLLIAFERPPPPENEHLAIGIAGAGFHGNLTSDSTRMRGYVLDTDIGPTILDRLGIEIPSQMSGEPIHSHGTRDVGAVVSLEHRLSTIIDRRGSVIGVSLLAWLLLSGVAALLWRRRGARAAIELLALSAIYLPLVLLLGAALEPGAGVERLLVMAGCPLLAAVTLLAAPGFRGLAVACALTTVACAVDVIAGSPLTALSLIGPDPGLGVRFFGIGNELEATLAVLVVAGTGAGIAGFAPALEARRCAGLFIGVAFLFAFVFAAGRFGADVGAAIVLPVGGAVAAWLIAHGARRLWLLIVAAPLLALAALALIDLISGGNAHLTRSVLDAGGFGQLGDVAQRRLQLSASSFGRGLSSPLFWIIVGAVAVAVWQRRTILAWLEPQPALRAGFLGAVAATAVGTLANDSGALLLELGAAFLLLFAAFAWAESTEERRVTSHE
jgi:hypothetical protein